MLERSDQFILLASLKTDHQLPPSLANFRDGFRFEWSERCPHQNSVSANGQRATVIYMGEDIDHAKVEETAKKASEYLHRGFSDPDESLGARQRLAVWYRVNNETVIYSPHRLLMCDMAVDASEFDIGRET